MKKIMTKALALFICIAFTGLQMSLADVLQTGMFADKDVLTGAQIKGHTAGLTKIETDASLNNATLHFNDHTRIDWNKLNVYKNQSLYFKNGNFGVLNNVVGTSISKFAGLIKADSGKVIIANPNGILFEGGKFEFNDFYKEFAIGGGLGLRLNIQFLIIRLDLAMKLHDPSKPIEERWVIKDTELQDLQLQFGIGYPF
jgi:filamentous hemagglutinin family protein